MAFNVQKCHIKHVGRSNPFTDYTMTGEKLAATDSERDIGVIIANNLKPAEQCKKAAQTASTVLAQIHRAFHFRDRITYVNLYIQYAQPHLEFSTPAWAPWNQGDIEVLERVQERAIKAVSSLRGCTYTERLQELGLPTLAQWRVEADMVLTYKILGDKSADYNEQWSTKMAMRTAEAH
jgi:hypothetical protein